MLDRPDVYRSRYRWYRLVHRDRYRTVTLVPLRYTARLAVLMCIIRAAQDRSAVRRDSSQYRAVATFACLLFLHSAFLGTAPDG